MPMPSRESRVRRAWRDTEGFRNWGRTTWAAFAGFVAVVVSDYSDLRSGKADAGHTLVSGLIGAAVVAVLVPVGEFVYNLAKAKRRIDADRVPLEEIWRAIEEDVRVHGAQLNALCSMGKRNFCTRKHGAALEALADAGYVTITVRHTSRDALTGEFVPDPWFIPVAEHFR